MRHLLFLVILFTCSCTQKKKTSVLPKPDKEIESNLNFDYAQNKTHCKQIYLTYKQCPQAEKERQFISFIKDSLMPCWYGTKWNFYGTTEEPRKGSIACGYFVTTVLRDAGLPVQRIKLAQCASEEMIKAVCDKPTIHRYRNISLTDFTKHIRNMEFGLYIVGLDNHTGFILNDSIEIYFIHSTYINPGCVIKEKANQSAVLASSKYRVIGKVKL